MEEQRPLLQGMSSIGRLEAVQSSLAGERMMAVRKKSGKKRQNTVWGGRHAPATCVLYIRYRIRKSED